MAARWYKPEAALVGRNNVVEEHAGRVVEQGGATKDAVL
jgi:hypothetical protein